MSGPIKSKHGDISKAPTPQNTPSSVTNSYLRSQPPTVPSIEEEDPELLRQIANNPHLLSMIQGKLSALVGKQSSYVSTLPKATKDRVYGLKAIQLKQRKVEEEFQKDLLELEKKYAKKYEPLFVRRKNIIVGDVEPTAEEIEEGYALEEEDDDEDDEEEKIKEINDDKEKADKEDDDEEEAESNEKGIPGFWLTAIENLTSISETITERDSEVLLHLIDIRSEYLETPGFELIFEFEENEYFSNQFLTKTYHYQGGLGYSGEFVYDHADGCEINWKSKENNVTINIERRKQRNKNTKQTRTIEKLTPTESFFNFFDPPKPPKKAEDEDDEDEEHDEKHIKDDEDDEDEEDEDAEEELEARLELDYQLGEEFKDRLIPRAIDWFTGDAVDYYPGEEEEFDEDDEEEDDDEDDDDEDDEDDEEDDDDEDDGQGQKDPPPECKQQ
ncbi:nucleosome assembly protein-domain-containing protein [Scheffersomyces coipomensis]|uniref:nucleosome assembly protein-domain-containing protein n=1 Tax=Scheffersomyces coipomensis TaxID=1788519 RepID=UPI00315C907D